MKHFAFKPSAIVFTTTLTLIAAFAAIFLTNYNSAAVSAQQQQHQHHGITGADFTALTDSDLRQMLDDYGVAYTPTSSRPELIRLVQQHESNPTSSSNSVASSDAGVSKKTGRGHVLKTLLCTG